MLQFLLPAGSPERVELLFLWKNGEGFECSRAFRELDSLTAFKSSDDCLDSASRRGLGSAEGSQDGDLDGRGFL